VAEILVIAARPALARSGITRAWMLAAAADGASRVQVRDLCALYPDLI
jgi:hypothetical protein